MSSAAERHRNNVRAGIFVSVAILLALAVVVVLHDLSRALTPMQSYTVRFPIDTGVPNLQRGSDVRVGGVSLGRVTAVRPVIDSTTALRDIDVDFELRADIALYDNAMITVTGPLIGAEAWLLVTSVGDDVNGQRLARGDRIEGLSAAGMLTALLGPANAGRADEMVANVQHFTDFLAGVPAEYRQRIVPMLDDAGMSLNDIRALVGRITNEDWPQWAITVNTTLRNVEAASATLDLVMNDGRELITNADRTVTETRGMIEDNRPQIDTFISNLALASNDVRVLTQHLAEDTLARFEQLIDRAVDGVDAFTRVGETIELELEGMMPGLRDIVANAQLAAGQLKLTTIEVRRSPWKVLYRPGTDELEHEMLYDAARAFALAVSDLKTTSEAVERLIQHHHARLSDDPATLRRLQERLSASFTRYEAAQRELLDIIVAQDR